MKSSFKEIFLGSFVFGASVFDKRIGSKAKDNNIDTNIKRSTCAGLLKFNSNWPIPRKEKVIII